MAWAVLVAWLIQGSVGAALVGRWRHGGRVHGGRAIATHVPLMVLALVPWIVFASTGAVVWGWIAFAMITVGAGFGDAVLLGGARAADPQGRGGYPGALRAMFSGRLPAPVVFHALFSPVVWFGALATCLVATV